ncbi:uncharacterized protein J8A68_000086 [[Candida] subhashii]|uniref:Uncharacterized protein n=1 Tax=[Candida] subhashii TaxID=561895 RepID=A0A8J5QZI8_9ASCO|nr:uncharacterized protein J8A68_000086 [[Candida] subhashii]KAG7666390.1 hypothetical protein J8A68_000086 [[Candida] subhashii]
MQILVNEIIQQQRESFNTHGRTELTATVQQSLQQQEQTQKSQKLEVVTGTIPTVKRHVQKVEDLVQQVETNNNEVADQATEGQTKNSAGHAQSFKHVVDMICTFPIQINYLDLKLSCSPVPIQPVSLPPPPPQPPPQPSPCLTRFLIQPWVNFSANHTNHTQHYTKQTSRSPIPASVRQIFFSPRPPKPPSFPSYEDILRARPSTPSHPIHSPYPTHRTTIAPTSRNPPRPIDPSYPIHPFIPSDAPIRRAKPHRDP